MIILNIIFSFIEVAIRVDKNLDKDMDFAKAVGESLRVSPYPIIYIVISVLSSLFVIVLCLYHHRLAWKSLTTNEDLKDAYFHNYTPNPYK